MAGREGQQFGKYKLIRFLEEGVIGGEIYLAEQVQTKNRVAIKVFNNRNDGGAYYYGKDFLQQAGRIPHTFKNILQVLDYGILDNQVDYMQTGYIVMEYITISRPFLEYYPRGTILERKTIVSFVKLIASALQYLQYHPIFDSLEGRQYILCPKNMWLSSNDEILLGGFEDALLTDIRAGRWIPIDVLRYEAPELNLHIRNNQYSLATIVYEWLCGELPFTDRLLEDSSDSWRRITPPSLREKNPAIPHEVETVVMKALSKDPEKRYETIQDFADALEKAIVPSKGDRFVLPDRSGEQFGKYLLVRRLGQGGFAEVYLGQHIKLKNNFVAIKMLYAHLTPKQLEELENEAQVVASLQHASIVRVFDVDIERNIPFLVMDYAPNGTMRQFHAKGSRLSLPTVVKYIKQIADALQLAHDQKIIHRDVKPENMLLGANNSIMLSDFGLAVIAHSTKSWKEQDRAGTAQYMAPEQFRGKPVPASDQYSLAVTAYEWLCGTTPFDEGDEIQLGFQHTMEPVPPMNERGAVVSQEVEQVIMKALAKEPTERFGSVKEFVEALEEAAQGGE